MKALHQSQFFTSYQSDSGRCFYFDLGQKIIKLSFCQLLALRYRVNKVDLDSHFNGQNPHGLEFISLCNREHLFIFNTLETADLKELIHGTFAMLELNSMVSA